MRQEIVKIRDHIIEQALLPAAMEGWSLSVLRDAACQAGYDEDMVGSVFPQGLEDALDHFAFWADHHMLERLRRDQIDPEDLRVRDRIRKAVLTRYEVLEPHKAAVRAALAFWARPANTGRAAKVLWRTADKIWNWAGDEAKDYNYYTKRGLLSGVISSTTLIWIRDDDFAGKPEQNSTARFLDDRIENVLKIGKTVGQGIGRLQKITGWKKTGS